MYQKFDMLEVPLMHDDVREKFSAQIMCSWVYHSLGIPEIIMFAEKTFWIMTSWWSLPMNCKSWSTYGRFCSNIFLCSGNLRVEISDRLTCDIQLESSYIVSYVFSAIC